MGRRHSHSGKKSCYKIRYSAGTGEATLPSIASELSAGDSDPDVSPLGSSETGGTSVAAPADADSLGWLLCIDCPSFLSSAKVAACCAFTACCFLAAESHPTHSKANETEISSFLYTNTIPAASIGFTKNLTTLTAREYFQFSGRQTLVAATSQRKPRRLQRSPGPRPTPIEINHALISIGSSVFRTKKGFCKTHHARENDNGVARNRLAALVRFRDRRSWAYSSSPEPKTSATSSRV